MNSFGNVWALDRGFFAKHSVTFSLKPLTFAGKRLRNQACLHSIKEGKLVTKHITMVTYLGFEKWRTRCNRSKGKAAVVEEGVSQYLSHAEWWKQGNFKTEKIAVRSRDILVFYC